MHASVRTPSSLVRERGGGEKEREFRKREGEREKEGGRERLKERERVFIFKKNDRCLGTFYLSSFKEQWSLL
jgi:hypothetical protein